MEVPFFQKVNVKKIDIFLLTGKQDDDKVPPMLGKQCMWWKFGQIGESGQFSQDFMKTNLGTLLSLPRLGVGAAFLGLLAFAPVSRASVILDNLGVLNGGHVTPNTTSYKTEGFSVSSGFAGRISSVTLALQFDSTSVTAGSILSILLYSANGSGQPGSSALITLGTITAANAGADHLYTLSGASLANYSVTVGNYAIVINEYLSSGKVAWETANAGNSGTGGSFTGEYFSANGSTHWTSSGIGKRGLEVDVVPEVPMTGMLMGIGALCLAGGHTLRRKLYPAKVA